MVTEEFSWGYSRATPVLGLGSTRPQKGPLRTCRRAGARWERGLRDQWSRSCCQGILQPRAVIGYPVSSSSHRTTRRRVQQAVFCLHVRLHMGCPTKHPCNPPQTHLDDDPVVHSLPSESTYWSLRPTMKTTPAV